MAKWWRKILWAVVAGGLFCLLGACNQAQVPAIVQSDDGQEVNQSYEQVQQEISQTLLEEEPVSTGEWFNDDWRDDFPPQRHDGPNMVYGDLVHKEDITMQVEGSNFTVADYQRIIRDYLDLYGSLWLKASAQQPDDAVAITGFQVVKDPEIVFMTPTGEVPAIFECRMYYALEGVKVDSPIYAGSGKEDYPETDWYSPTSHALFQIDEQGVLTYLTGFTDSWFGIGKKGVIPIGAINEARSLYQQEHDAARPQIISEKWSIVEEAWERCVYRAEVVQLLDGQESTHTYDYIFAKGQLVEFDYF